MLLKCLVFYLPLFSFQTVPAQVHDAPAGIVGVYTTAPSDQASAPCRCGRPGIPRGHNSNSSGNLVPCPDYVFKEGYDLKILEEVQKHINEYGHLPNIPSAQEMGANGIQVGGMNMKLLERIEESTLHAI